MNVIVWLLIYDVVFAGSVAATFLLAKSARRQLNTVNTGITKMIRLAFTASALILTLCLVLYMSGVMTYASTR